MAYNTEAARWRALTIRDPNANGQFIYAVKSTNCYCRPTCPARLARRANVVFYKTATEAEAAGFRACKRCKPGQQDYEDPQERAVAKACVLIEDALKENDSKVFRLQDLAKSVGLTPRYFHKIFKDKTGLTPKEYAKAKMGKAEGVEVSEGAAANPGLMELATGDFNFDDLVDLEFDPSLAGADGPLRASPDMPTPDVQTPLPGIPILDPNVNVGIHAPYSDPLDPVFAFPDPAIFGHGKTTPLGGWPFPPDDLCTLSTTTMPPMSSFELGILSGNNAHTLSQSNNADGTQGVRPQDAYQDFVW